MNRRHFLKSSAAGLALSTIPNYALDFSSSKKRVGLIGSGWYGKCDLLRLIQVSPVDVVSLCDVDSQMLNAAADIVASRQLSGKRPRLYSDYREMLKEKDLDIVLIDTPDHWHALPMIEAVKSGADVYVQKPTGVDVIESQAMLNAARKYGRVVQVGTQRRSTPHLIEAKELIDEGRLGKIGHVELCCYYHMRNRNNPPNSTPPSHFDYDMWTGPAPMLPYNSLVHPRKWRAYMEYGNGIMGDMCVHMFDMARWMMNLGWPTNISSTGGVYIDKNSRANTPDSQTTTFDYGDFQAVWTHRSWGDAPDPEYPWAAIFYGEKGTLKASVHKYDFIPRDKKAKSIHRDVTFELEQYPEDKTEKALEKHVAPAIRGHMKDFLNCIANRSRPVADIEEGHISSASCILANLSMQLGRSLKWDPIAHRVIGDDEANALLARPYRSPWIHPDPNNV
ncbi:MAG: putative dehydrogenase [Candidatus Pelagisphaera sp.]|jgi:predicted dehydrogenase